MAAGVSGEGEEEMAADVDLVAVDADVLVTKDLPAKSLVRFLILFDDSYSWFVLLLPIKQMILLTKFSALTLMSTCY